MTIASSPAPRAEASEPALSPRTPRGLAPSSRPRRAGLPVVIALLLLCDAALCLVYIVNFALPIPSGTFLRIVDIDGEDSIANWYSSAKYFALAALFLLFAARNFGRRRASSWPLLLFPLLFLAMSADEIVQIHEWLGRKTDALLPGGDREGTAFHATGIWMFVIGLPFLVIVLGLFHCTRRFFLPAPGVAKKFVLGVCILIAGAGGVETLTNFAFDPQSLAFHLEVCAEEFLEMAGVTVISWAAHDLLLANGFSIHLAPAT